MTLVQLMTNFPGPYPRYNYYPRTSQWQSDISVKSWHENIKSYHGEEIDLYIHLPFCQSLCSFCGCNTKKLNSDTSISEYLDALESEISTYDLEKFKLENIYIGGGTPNALSKNDFERLFSLFSLKDVKQLHCEFDLRYFNEKRFDYLLSRGLTHLSFGLQDDNERTLKAIGRPTDLNKVITVLKTIKKKSSINVNIDLLYGLPHQKKESLIVKEILEKDLINSASLYPFAIVPWFQDFYPLWHKARPSNEEKFETLASRIELFENYGYKHIGYGHIYHSEHEVNKAYQEGTLQRTVMGFTTKKNKALIGIGVSAISETGEYLKQNSKNYSEYLYDPKKFDKGHKKTNNDLLSSKIIDQITLQSSFQKLPESSQISTELFTSKGDQYILNDHGRFILPFITQQLLSGIK